MDILRAILLSLESMIEDPELQVNGFILIIDWSNFTFKQASKLTPSMLRLAIEGLQVRSCCCSPLLARTEGSLSEFRVDDQRNRSIRAIFSQY